MAQGREGREGLEQVKMIPVTERLPERVKGHYLVFAPKSFPKNSRFVVAEYYDDNKTFYSESDEMPMKDVTHWAELPEEPKAAQAGKEGGR